MAARVSAPSESPVPTDGGGGRVQVPKTNVDPVASLAPTSLTVKVAGTLYEIPAHPAVFWLSILMDSEPDFWDLFPGCLDEEDQDAINEAMLEGSLGVESLDEICLDIVATISARPWWVAIRLIELARANWHVLGAEMLMRGVDATRLSLAGWLDVLLLTVMRNIDPKEVTMFTMKLEQIPAYLQIEQPEPEMNASSFMSMA